MAEKSERGMGGIKCKSCKYWSDKCKEINFSRQYQSHQPTDSLCWCCENAVPDKEGLKGCEWSMYKQPVKGWRVVEAAEYHMADGRICKSYKVSSCPKFARG